MPPTGTERSGEPFADAFGVLGFSEGAFITVADGVGWGVKPRRAARCAVLATMQFMLGALQAQGSSASLQTSDAAFRAMINAMRSAQQLILKQGGSLTTLVMATVCRIKGARAPNQYALMTVTIGDSSAFVWRRASRSVDEVTYAAHADAVREVRMCPGCLGPAMGDSPDLENMTCSLTTVAEGDVVLLGSDGVGDNLDPTVLRLSRPPPKAVPGPLDPIYDLSLPINTPRDIHAHVKRRLLGVVEARPQLPPATGGHGDSGPPPALVADMTAAHVCDRVLDYVWKTTLPSRTFVELKTRERHDITTAAGGASAPPAEAPDINSAAAVDNTEPSVTAAATDVSAADVDAGPGSIAARVAAAAAVARITQELVDAMQHFPGKMDHATAAAYVVGQHRSLR